MTPEASNASLGTARSKRFTRPVSFRACSLAPRFVGPTVRFPMAHRAAIPLLPTYSHLRSRTVLRRHDRQSCLDDSGNGIAGLQIRRSIAFQSTGERSHVRGL